MSRTEEPCHLVTQGSWKSKLNKEAPTKNEAKNKMSALIIFFLVDFEKNKTRNSRLDKKSAAFRRSLD